MGRESAVSCASRQGRGGPTCTAHRHRCRRPSPKRRSGRAAITNRQTHKTAGPPTGPAIGDGSCEQVRYPTRPAAAGGRGCNRNLGSARYRNPDPKSTGRLAQPHLNGGAADHSLQRHQHHPGRICGSCIRAPFARPVGGFAHSLQFPDYAGRVAEPGTGVFRFWPPV